jgi:hypothetical protein
VFTFLVIGTLPEMSIDTAVEEKRLPDSAMRAGTLMDADKKNQNEDQRLISMRLL